MVRQGRQHLAVAQEAGHGRLSFVSVLAGLVTAYGTFAIIASIVGAVLAALDVDTDFSTNDWTGTGAVAVVASALSLLLAYLFGGYVAGRMARRSAMLHGIAVFVGSLVVIAIVSGVVSLLTDDAEIRENLRSLGLPTAWDQVSGPATAGVIVSLVAMLVGSLIGAQLGERWHTRLARRVADPTIGRSAAIRESAAREEEASVAAAESEPVIRRDLDAERDVTTTPPPVAAPHAASPPSPPPPPPTGGPAADVAERPDALRPR
ncbi:MAG: hypothetical protein ACYC2O_13655 [Microthrixaceae bacterium]